MDALPMFSHCAHFFLSCDSKMRRWRLDVNARCFSQLKWLHTLSTCRGGKEKFVPIFVRYAEANGSVHSKNKNIDVVMALLCTRHKSLRSNKGPPFLPRSDPISTICQFHFESVHVHLPRYLIWRAFISLKEVVQSATIRTAMELFLVVFFLTSRPHTTDNSQRFFYYSCVCVWSISSIGIDTEVVSSFYCHFLLIQFSFWR